MSNRLIDRLMGAIRNSQEGFHSSSKCAKTQADERLVYESLKADPESDDPEDHFDHGRRG